MCRHHIAGLLMDLLASLQLSLATIIWLQHGCFMPHLQTPRVTWYPLCSPSWPRALYILFSIYLFYMYGCFACMHVCAPQVCIVTLEIKRRHQSQVVVTYTFNPSTQETEAGGSLHSGQPGLQSELQNNQGYTEKPCRPPPKK